MPTLDDVARAAGVSKSTASRALSRPALVAPETVLRVRQSAERLGFVPNRAATALARGRTGIVAVVVPTLENAFFTPIIGGAQHRAAESGLQLTVVVNALRDDSDLDSLTQLSAQVDGFLLTAPLGSESRTLAACQLKPTVLVDREIAGVSSVIADTATAFAAVARHFIRDGHQRIALVGGSNRSWQNEQRIAAVRAATAGLAELAIFDPMPPTFAAGTEIAPALAESGATAVIPYATALGLGIVFALGARGVAVPDGMAITIERQVAAALGLTTMPTIDVDGAELGRTAMSALHDLMTRDTAETAARLRLPVPVVFPPGG
ncbi:LacI family DNA-binding transcriptional regulator [Streptomyces millisiae]|uniref:LacI family DNA-binding transcriptional regulator n=1 Tax=Streptomyces millisiae TaxID=3075542 RepID=A0ABU2LLR8_9ACTN|nr:LacI family DNA-binding transcriptional regulator [Streptomyces sp. DSM 44918]MDT0318213.1 LacI family DNA-binding transcriptional regulator [Streptomyces sp. DSM 44918]